MTATGGNWPVGQPGIPCNGIDPEKYELDGMDDLTDACAWSGVRDDLLKVCWYRYSNFWCIHTQHQKLLGILPLPFDRF